MAEGASELDLLVEDPNETLAVEYKSWLQLDERRHQADLARHIAAIANYGGGAIVFGFEDDLQPSAPDAGAIARLTRDDVSSVVKRYLDPPIQCDLSIVTSSRGNHHPIIRVPAHGAVPIISTKNGPDEGGAVQGIAGATIYIRKTGPESAPVMAGSDLTDLIRRCTLHDRASIIAALSSALPGAAPANAAPTAIDRWHEAAEREFLRRIQGRVLAIDLSKLRWQFSFALTTTDGERLGFDALKRAMREVAYETGDTVETGWSMFFPFDPPHISPQWTSDLSSGDDEDILQTSLIEPDTINNTCDFWRLSTLGMGTLIREYWEDRPDKGVTMRGAGERLDIDLLRRNLTEFVRYARGLAERFGQASSMTFRCDWHGLAGRMPTAGHYGSIVGRPPQVMARTSRGNWPIGELTNNWPLVVEQLAGPIARTFEVTYQLSEKAVREQPRRLR